MINGLKRDYSRSRMAIILAVVLFSSDLGAFAIIWPWNIHQEITGDALQPAYFEIQLPNQELVSFSPQVISIIQEANKETDEIQTPNRHFDSESFQSSQGRLVQLRIEIVASLIDNAYVDSSEDGLARREVLIQTARETTGTALHTLQDYYAHSNWTERRIQAGDLERTNADLGKSGVTLQLPGQGELCIDSQPWMTSHTSGYYFADGVFDDAHVCQAPNNKCAHGNGLPQSVNCGINKDNPTREHHNEAFDLAWIHTGNFVREIINTVLADSTDPLGSVTAVCMFMGVPDYIATCLPAIPIVDIPFTDSALEACVEAKAATQGWVLASEATEIICKNAGIASLGGLEYLTNVSYLDFEQNVITSLEPLRELSELSFVSVRNNNLSSIEPLKDHTKIEFLKVDLNPLITDISYLQNYPVLYELNLNKTGITDISPLGDLTTLGRLDMDFLGLTDADLSNLQNLTQLTRLSLNSNQNITNISVMQNMLSLQTLSVIGNKIQDLSPLAALTNIIVLSAAVNQIANVTALQNKPAMVYLGLDHNKVSNATPLHGLTQLLNLTIRYQVNNLDCEQQQTLKAALPGTNVLVDGFWNDPHDDPDEGNINCFP